MSLPLKFVYQPYLRPQFGSKSFAYFVALVCPSEFEVGVHQNCNLNASQNTSLRSCVIRVASPARVYYDVQKDDMGRPVGAAASWLASGAAPPKLVEDPF